MHLDPIIPPLVSVVLCILVIATALRLLRQPYVVAYIVTGAVVGPGGIALITDRELVDHLGAVGVVLLLFFVGMEVSPRRLLANWKVALIGTIVQILASVGCVWALGAWLEWPLQRCILLGFVISLSSTAVVLKLLHDRQEMNSDVGQDVLGILLVQDLALIPMMIVIGLLGESGMSLKTVSIQTVGGVLVVSLALVTLRPEPIRLPYAQAIRKDHELQIFVAVGIALGLALITGLFELSSALGAFTGGMLIASARETDWVHRSLDPFRVVFVALFFVSVGMLIDLDFLAEHWWKALVLVGAVFLTNTFINTLTLRMFGDNWAESLYAGALLAEIGEFSFVLASVGLHARLINEYSYKMTVIVIALSLLFSPAWIAGIRMCIQRSGPGKSEGSQLTDPPN